MGSIYYFYNADEAMISGGFACADFYSIMLYCCFFKALFIKSNRVYIGQAVERVKIIRVNVLRICFKKFAPRGFASILFFASYNCAVGTGKYNWA